VISTEVILLGLGNLGTVVWVAKKTVSSVERHDQILPRLVAIADNMEKHLPILYDRDNQIADRVSRLEQTHKIKGCDKPEG
jgi:hypothetical protein